MRQKLDARSEIKQALEALHELGIDDETIIGVMLHDTAIDIVMPIGEDVTRVLVDLSFVDGSSWVTSAQFTNTRLAARGRYGETVSS